MANAVSVPLPRVSQQIDVICCMRWAPSTTGEVFLVCDIQLSR
jgi:hypothetical protein